MDAQADLSQPLSLLSSCRGSFFLHSLSLGKAEMKKKLGVGLTFHDETPSTPSAKFASVPSEFQQKSMEQGNSVV